MGSNTKSVVIFKTIRLILAGMVFISFSSPAFADQYDEQIAALRRQVAAQQAEVSSLKGQQNNLQNKIATINAEIGRSMSELQLARARHQKVSADLEIAKQNLLARRQTLGHNLKTIYIQSQISPLEVFASAGTFTEYLDYQEYLNSLRQNIQQSITEITDLKAQLERDQLAQQQLIGEQQGLQYGLSIQRSEVAGLLAETRGLEANYQSKIAADKSRISQLQAAQAAEIAARSRRTGGGAVCGGGYPGKWCNYPKDSLVDDWGFYNRECTSYAAWKRWAIGRPIPSWGRMGRANAKDWPGWARATGYRVDGIPEVGAIGVYGGGFYGHVMIVEQIRGSKVLVSDYNSDFQGNYGASEWNISDLQFIH
jgi:surface antigen/cell division protein FtsB